MSDDRPPQQPGDPTQPYGQQPPPPPPGPPPPPPPGYGEAPGQQPPPGYGMPPAQTAPQNGMGVAALVLGIIGLLTALVPVILIWLAIPLGIVGAVLGFIGRSKAKKGQATNGGMAMAGIITSIAAIVISIAWSVVFAAVIATNSDKFSNYTDCVERTPVEQLDRCDRYLD